jgi:hypothetical protein
MFEQVFAIDEPFVLVRDFQRTLMPTFEYGQDDMVVRRLRGKKCRTYSAFMDEIGAALQFFGGFGENWSAVADLLQTMDEWLPGSGYVLLIEEAELLFSDEEVELVTFGRILEMVGKYWAAPIVDNGRFSRVAMPFHVVLEGNVGSMVPRLGRAGIAWEFLRKPS